MKKRKSNEAQSLQIGFILLIALVVTFAGILQVTQVPVQEENTELEHNEKIKSQLTKIADILASPNGLSSAKLEDINLGTNYEDGFIFITPIPKQHGLDPQGTIRSDFEGTISVNNITKFHGPNNFEQVNKNTSNKNTSIVIYKQDSIEYSVNYNRISDGIDYRYDNSVFYVEGENNETVPLSNQRIIRGNNINFPLLDSNITESGIGQSQVLIKPISTGGGPVQIEVESDSKIKFESKLDLSDWKDLIGNERKVNKVSSKNGDIVIDIKRGIYNLQVSKVLFQSSDKRRIFGSSPTQPQYIYHEPPNWTSIGNSPIEISGTVRDRFHNPVPNSKVNIILTEPNNGEFSSSGKDETTIQTNKYGKFTDKFESSSNGDIAKFDFNLP